MPEEMHRLSFLVHTNTHARTCLKCVDGRHCGEALAVKHRLQCAPLLLLTLALMLTHLRAQAREHTHIHTHARTCLKCIRGRHCGEALAVLRSLRNLLLAVVQVVDGEHDLGLPQAVGVVILPVCLQRVLHKPHGIV
eukprot:1158675-Pelagomonas_calceolata.AAC.3